MGRWGKRRKNCAKNAGWRAVLLGALRRNKEGSETFFPSNCPRYVGQILLRRSKGLRCHTFKRGNQKIYNGGGSPYSVGLRNAKIATMYTLFSRENVPLILTKIEMFPLISKETGKP
jgi:hypothetical protein